MDINTYTPELKKYLPPILQDITEFAALHDSENPEFCIVWEAVKNTLKDQFIDELTATGIERWEKILNLAGNGDLSDRRLEIKSRVSQDGTYTLQKLKDTLSTLCGGDDEYTCELHAEDYKLVVRIKLTSTNKFDTVKKLLTDVTPANLIIDLSLLYNQHKTLKVRTHGELKSYTYNDLRNSSQLMLD